MYEWKQPITREEVNRLNQVSTVARLRGQFKAQKRATVMQKRDVQIRKRYIHDEQAKLAGWYLRNWQ